MACSLFDGACSMAERRWYTDAERAAALAYYDSIGGKLTQAAKDLEVPLLTLRGWILRREERAAGAVASLELQSEKREELADLCEKVARRAVELIFERDDEASYRDLVTGLGVSVDKMRLLRDQTTANFGDTPSVERLKALLDAQRERDRENAGGS